ncbi:MAG: LLM class flavin-dependent oxidoreductase [Deltaproteobacteria bacterium]|nr:LLM class flavin-dependent oxidoreductase [Deltaproteobacteria bacterium]MBI3390003.1 LLM class flavin-dependent oxidoreductase [Deltaproteobacteria bacterium]
MKFALQVAGIMNAMRSSARLYGSPAATGDRVRNDQMGIEAVVSQTLLAESLGFDAVFVPDHYVFEAMGTLRPEVPAYELFFVMATLVQRTRTIRIASYVACMLYRHPAMHARLLAQVDEASDGRVIAGVGAGWMRAEFEMMGIDFPDVSERLQRMDEAVAIIRGLWRPEPFTLAGKFYRVKDAVCLPRPMQQPHPPLMLGGSGAGILRRAGEWADIVHMVPALGKAGTATLTELQKFNDAAVRQKLARVREAEARAGRPKGAVQYASTIFNLQITSSLAQTRQVLEGMAAFFGPTAEQARRHPMVLAGTPGEIVDELRRRESEHGLSLLAINVKGEEQLTEFGEKVVAKM